MNVELEDVPADLVPAVVATLAATGTDDCHLAVELVDRDRIHELNREHRNRDSATDVLSFPVDFGSDSPGPRELGDVFVCEAECEDLVEAVVHGVLHLCGYDHETDDGEMLELQDRIMVELGGSR
jgi:probable rRNA maturation factor